MEVEGFVMSPEAPISIGVRSRSSGHHVRTLSLALIACGASWCANAVAAAPPNWTGVYELVHVLPGATERHRGGALPVFKGEYAVRAQARKQSYENGLKTGKPILEPEDGCGPQSFWGEWNFVYGYEFVMGPTQVNINLEYKRMTRRIYLDGRPHPDLDNPAYERTYLGHSIGHWEGNTLVVDTVGIRFDDGSYSDKLHIVERITSPKPGTLEVNVTVNDPEALAQTLRLNHTLHRKNWELQDFWCENERNPVGPNGEVLTILKDK